MNYRRFVILLAVSLMLIPAWVVHAQTAATEVPEGLERYEAANFPVALVYDPDLWDVVKNVPAERNDGRDLLRLRSRDDALPATLSVESFDAVSRASECFDLKLGEIAPSPSSIEPITERNGDAIADSRRGIKYAAYSLKSGKPDADAFYLECRALPAGRGVTALTLVTGTADFDDALDAALDVFDTIAIVERATPTPTATALLTIDTPADALFVSPNLGYYVAAIDGWAFVIGDSDDVSDGVAFIDPNGLDIRLRANRVDGNTTVESCIQDTSERYSNANGVDLTVAPEGMIDRPSTGRDDGTAYGLFSYEFQGVSRVLYIWCGSNPDGTVLVSIHGSTTVDAAAVMVAAVDAAAAGVRVYKSTAARGWVAAVDAAAAAVRF